MHINDFKSYINKTILDRGYNYYMEGRVVDSYKQSILLLIAGYQPNQKIRECI
ncbi:hypothetical protein [Robertmurraya sp. FSL R5-0851]|uniref:hypothetical protein n=1 Tax=Robertmurraya sp. FSL R5-0851 TaxID=2921584 RepID=UPI0030F5D843